MGIFCNCLSRNVYCEKLFLGCLVLKFLSINGFCLPVRPTKWFCWCSVFSIIFVRCFSTRTEVLLNEQTRSFWVCNLSEFCVAVCFAVDLWSQDVILEVYKPLVHMVSLFVLKSVKNCYCKILSRRCNLYKPVGCWLMFRKCVQKGT